MQPDSMDASSLRHLIDFLQRERVITAENIRAPRLTPAEQCAQAYAQHLREVRGLAEATIVHHVPFICGFLTDCFGDSPVMLSRLSGGDVVQFVQRQAPHLHLKRAKLLTS